MELTDRRGARHHQAREAPVAVDAFPEQVGVAVVAGVPSTGDEDPAEADGSQTGEAIQFGAS